MNASPPSVAAGASPSPAMILPRQVGTPTGGRRFTQKVALAVVILAAAAFFAFASYGFDSPFYYGHYGYHGGSYATWSRGSVRHHTLFPVNEPGFAPPRPGTYYIHHPLLAPQMVTLTFALFGEHEWTVRLAGLISSSLCLLLLTGLAWRRLGPLAGATAAAVFAVVPVNVWYSVNIDPGFPSIACLLGALWCYLRWLETGRWKWGAAALGLEALAGGFEWSPYFAFVPIFVHVARTGLRRRGRYLVFAALHPLVVVVPIVAHFLMVWHIGMLDDLRGAYRNRAAQVSYRHFVKVMGEYGETLFGRVLLFTMALWLVLTLVRVLRGKVRSVDVVGLTFAFSLVVYVHVFKVAVITHAYRLLYGNVWAAWAAADVAAIVGRATEQAWTRWVRPPAPAAGAGRAATGLVALVVAVATAPIAWAGLLESRAHGGIPGWKTFNPDLRQTAFSDQVNRATVPGDVLYFHPSFANPPPYRMDWAFYYDRDLQRGTPLRVLQMLPAARQKRAVVLLQTARLAPDELQAFGELARRHPVLRIEDLVMLDLRYERAELHAFSITPPTERGGAGALRRWLEGPYPLPRLLADAPARAADESLIRAAATVSPPSAPTGAPPPPTPGTPPAPASTMAAARLSAVAAAASQKRAHRTARLRKSKAQHDRSTRR